MSETEPIQFVAGRPASSGSAARRDVTAITSIPGRQRTAVRPPVVFDRRELDKILSIYGRHVAAGEWRDYAIDMLTDRAVFSIFRNASEVPIYRIEKNPKHAGRQGAYSVITPTGLIIKRGRDLAQVLRVLEPRPKLMPV